MLDFIFDLNPEAIWRFVLSGVTALLVILAGLVVSSWLSASLRRVADRTDLDPTLSRFFSRILRWVVLLITVLFVLGEFGIETASFSVILGAAGLAIGLALQGTLSNFASGVMLLMFRPFKIGDVIKVVGELGTVQEIDLFSTVIDTFDSRRLILPNGKIFADTIENVTYHPKRRVDISVGVDYTASITDTRVVLESALARVDAMELDPAPAVVLIGLGASSVDWSVRVWAARENFGTVRESLIRSIKESLDDAGIGIPFPQMDVHLDGQIESRLPSV